MARKRGERGGEGPFPEPDLLPLMNIILHVDLGFDHHGLDVSFGFSLLRSTKTGTARGIC